MARKLTDDKKNSTDSTAPPPPPAYSCPPGMTMASPNFSLREKAEAPPPPPGDGQHRRLHILGATWGGVVVTPQVAAMVSDRHDISINMLDLVHILTPDPALGHHKRLTVLYQLDGQEGPTLVNIDEQHPVAGFAINAALHETDLARPRGVDSAPPFPAVEQLPVPWRSATFYNSNIIINNNTTTTNNNNSMQQSAPGVEILSVTYGPKRIATPKVLQDLGDFFEGRRGQIRMNNAFFMEDTHRNNRKTWTVYFRFGPTGRVQVVTGWEDGALEVPWSRWA